MSRGGIVIGATLALVLGACSSSGGGRERGSTRELGELLEASGAESVPVDEIEGQAPPPEGDPHALPDLDTAEVMREALEERRQGAELPEPPELSPYIRFGERILVKRDADGSLFITKPYPMPPGKAQKLVELILAMEPFSFVPRPAREAETGKTAPLEHGAIHYHLLPEWDEEHYGDLAADTPAAAQVVKLSDILVVTAPPDLLATFEEFLDTFSAGVPQIELEAKIIEIVDSDALDVGIIPIDKDTPIIQSGDGNLIKSFTYNLSNASDPFEALLTFGAVQDGLAFNAILEIISRWENVSIDSRPKTVVRAGGVARLESAVEIPFFSVGSITPNGGFNATIDYKRVGVKLYISPRVVGSKKLALDVHLEGSQTVGFQRTVQLESSDGTSSGGSSGIDVPIIAYRTAKTVVYLEPGQTLVIGGLTQERSQDVVTKIPILGDIPLLGHLFRSTFKQVDKEHVIFAISPRIVQTSELQPEL